MERILYLFATQHTSQDIHGLPEKLDRDARKQWKWIEEQVITIPSPNRAYFDSLHNDNYVKKLEIVNFVMEHPEMLQKVPPEIQVMVQLTEQKTMIESTEDSSLYMKYVALGGRVKTGLIVTLSELFESLDDRDKAIARRIRETLMPGETGFLFQGAEHTIYRFLTSDIKLGVYWGRAPFPKRTWFFNESDPI